jgi:tryptophan synthase alpha chain
LKNLVAYITTGYPSLSFTIDVSSALKEAGVDTLELGIPFSDPMADGKVIEQANLKALQNGFKLDNLFDVSKKIAPKIDTLWMGYFNPFYHKGIEIFIKKAKISGVNGFIIPDLPFEEAKPYKSIIKSAGLNLIDFIAPTDSRDRVKKIVNSSQKFIYLVAYTGITGSQQNEDLNSIIEYIREFTTTPIYIGFGIDEKSAKEKVKGVDGVIVGSTFIKILLDEKLRYNQRISKIAVVAKEIKEKINE